MVLFFQFKHFLKFLGDIFDDQPCPEGTMHQRYFNKEPAPQSLSCMSSPSWDTPAGYYSIFRDGARIKYKLMDVMVYF